MANLARDAVLAPGALDDARRPALLAQVQQAHAQVANVGDHHLLVGNGGAHVGRADHQRHAAQLADRLEHQPEVGALGLQQRLNVRLLVTGCCSSTARDESK